MPLERREFLHTLTASGLAAAASIMNAVILTAVLSAGNSGLYVSRHVPFLYFQDVFGTQTDPYLRVHFRLSPSPQGAYPNNQIYVPTLKGWNLYVSCPPTE